MKTKSDLIREAQKDPSLTIPGFDSDINVVQQIKEKADKMNCLKFV